MSPLEKAQKRLAEALARLETALMQRLTQGGSGAPVDYEPRLAAITAERDALTRDVDRLQEECGRLSTALKQAQRDHRNLRDVTDHVARQIDGSIAEIDRLLEG